MCLASAIPIPSSLCMQPNSTNAVHQAFISKECTTISPSVYQIHLSSELLCQTPSSLEARRAIRACLIRRVAQLSTERASGDRGHDGGVSGGDGGRGAGGGRADAIAGVGVGGLGAAWRWGAGKGRGEEKGRDGEDGGLEMHFWYFGGGKTKVLLVRVGEVEVKD